MLNASTAMLPAAHRRPVARIGVLRVQNGRYASLCEAKYRDRCDTEPVPDPVNHLWAAGQLRVFVLKVDQLADLAAADLADRIASSRSGVTATYGNQEPWWDDSMMS